MAMEWAYGLVTRTTPPPRRRLDNVIVLLVPSLNPDGQIMVTEWYRKYVGTKYEGGRRPLLPPLHGHDDNRDWYMLTQIETKACQRHGSTSMVSSMVWLDEHQMGSTGRASSSRPDADPWRIRCIL